MTAALAHQGTETRSTSTANSGYGAVHARLYVAKGKASQHLCVHCGRQARDWAYDHRDPAARRDRLGLLYSTDPERYLPLCRPCHVRFDADYRGGQRA